MVNFLEYIKNIPTVMHFGEGAATEPPWQRNGRVLLLLVFLLIVLKNSYVCEDALITLRTVDNWVNGFGLRWNVAERLQVFTHPLWMFAMSAVYAVTREVFYSILIFSLIISGAAVGIYSLKVAASACGMFAGLTILIMSRAFMDFSTSGLENPLVHLFIIVFMIYWRKLKAVDVTPMKLFGLSLISCLCVLTRMDTGLIFLPALLYMGIGAVRHSNRRRLIIALALGYVPFFLWEIFCLFYYGFLLPNTYYAKMAHGVPKSEILLQGFFYLRNTLDWDPITLFTILAALFFGFKSGYRHRFNISVSLGILLYLIYIVSVGGDHMAGRFLTGPLIAAVILLTTMPFSSRFYALMIVIALILGFNSRMPTLSTNSETRNCKLDSAEIIDEAACCRFEFSLLSRHREFPFSQNFRAVAGKKERAKGPHAYKDGMAGIVGYYAGPKVHIIDVLGLADPLLARLPMAPIHWRIAHFGRRIPDGYMDAAIDKGEIKDPSLALYYEKLNILTRGNLWSLDRLAEIWKFNTGHYEHLRQEYCRRQFNVKSCDRVYLSRHKTVRKNKNKEQNQKSRPKNAGGQNQNPKTKK
jgi:arabinofuranosyltransferase